jgi:hypothetical protein
MVRCKPVPRWGCNQTIVECKGKTIKAHIERNRFICRLSIQWRLDIFEFPLHSCNDPARQKSRAEPTWKEATISYQLGAFSKKPKKAAINI